MKNLIIKIWNWLDAMTTRMEEAVEWVSDTEDRIMKNKEVDQKRERKILDHKSRLLELGDSLKCNNIYIIGLSEEEEKEERKGGRRFIWGNYIWKVP